VLVVVVVVVVVILPQLQIEAVLVVRVVVER
jgi:hypothetical protein